VSDAILFLVTMNGVRMGVDIGGTLAEAVVFVPESAVAKVCTFLESSGAVCEPELYMKAPGGRLIFLKFPSNETNQAWERIARRGLFSQGTPIAATGGGAFKFQGLTGDMFPVQRFDELSCLVEGLNVMRKYPRETFSVENVLFHGAKGSARERIVSFPVDLSSEPFLCISIGSGVSILYCDGNDANFERVGGSSLGGSTFLGLTALLTGVESFDEALELAAQGDSAKVDLLVKDIYGNGKQIYGLRSSTLASSFGKMIDTKERKSAKREDLALSALIMCSINVAALAHLHANIKRTKHVVFTGSFLARNRKQSSQDCSLHLRKRNTIAMRTLAYSMSFWSNGARQAVFFQHEGFLGAIGAFQLGDLASSPQQSFL